ncbi:helix-turn-helix transcriptional regulator [Streptomyces sp. RFCAC02]|uniref:helix-turn-helix domain-containing protein n=1 Tax=Streptomyces sp. RFCAC02 TaxID=2499143 RepID=UPI00101F4547|nr:helix-turn-helix transcriptional regulator [Streptomyces sp. RFCAC02]
MGEATGSTVPRRLLGRHLRELRLRAQFTLKRAATAMEWSEAKMSRIEAGLTSVRTHDVRLLCTEYGAPEELREALVGLASETKAKGWWHAYGDAVPRDFDVFIGLEAAASAVDWYEPDLVPGLFQTPRYARVMMSEWYDKLAPEEIERRTSVRMRRQALLTRTRQPLSLRVVLSEAVLLRPVGGPDVMFEQAERIVELSALPNVELRVIPFERGFHQGMFTGQFGILKFPAISGIGEPTTVYADGYVGDLYLDKPDESAHYAGAFADMWSKALDEQATQKLLRRAVGSYERHG